MCDKLLEWRIVKHMLGWVAIPWRSVQRAFWPQITFTLGARGGPCDKLQGVCWCLAGYVYITSIEFCIRQN